MTLEEKLSKCVDDRGVALTVISRRTGLPYTALYDSLKNKSKNREIKGKELIKLCRFLNVDPMDLEFVEKTEAEGQGGQKDG